MIIAIIMREEKFTILRFFSVFFSVVGGLIMVGIDKMIMSWAGIGEDKFDTNELFGYGLALVNIID